eukprot:scaffold1440_cov23-Cyclotella_meneghiniana.AAC.4
MAEAPTQPFSSPEGSGSGPDPRQAGAFRFWRAFATSNHDACREALQTLAEIRGEEYSDLAMEGSFSPDSGKYLMVDLPATSPKNARDAWNSDRNTTLARVDPEVHCLSFDGDIAKYDDGDYFVACGMEHPSSIGLGACNVGTHKNAGRKRFDLEGPAYVVKVKASSAATKPKVLGGCFLLEASFPREVKQLGLDLALLGYSATPRVWRIVIENYPGLGRMIGFMGIRSEEPQSNPPIVVETVNEESLYDEARSQVSVPEQVDTEPRRSDFSLGGSVASGGRSAANASMPPGHRFQGIGDNWELDSVSSWRRRAGISLPGAMPTLNWETALKQTEAKLRSEIAGRFKSLDASLDVSFAAGDKRVEYLHRRLGADCRDATTEASQALEKALVLEEAFNKRLIALETRSGMDGGVGTGGLTIDTGATPKNRKVGWDELSPVEQEKMLSSMIDQLDVERLSEMVSAKLGVTSIKEELRRDGLRLVKIEQEFASEHGTVTKLQEQMATWDARRNSTSSKRGGCVFSGPQDVQALVTMAGSGKLCTLCLDLHGMLTLAQDDFRDGSHGRVIKGIDNAFELTQRAIDHAFPLSFTGDRGGDGRKVHTILSDQNRRAYRSYS